MSYPWYLIPVSNEASLYFCLCYFSYFVSLIAQLVSAQEVERKRGVPLDQTEEQIRMRLEDLYMQLMQPTQYRVSGLADFSF